MFIFGTLLGLQTPVCTHAEDGIAAEEPTRRLDWAGIKVYIEEAEPDRPARLRFLDGRVAGVQLLQAPAFKSDVTLSLIETTCTDKLPPLVCKMHYTVQVTWVQLIWLENPLDPKRVGKAVERIGDGPVLNRQIIIGPEDRFTNAEVPFSMPQMSCENWSWLPPSFIQNKSFEVSEWTREDMDANEETGMNENRADASFRNVKMSFIDKSRVQVHMPKRIAPTKYDTPFLIGGDAVGLTMPLGDGEYCEASFRTEYGDLIAKLNNTQGAKIIKDFKTSHVVWENFNRTIYIYSTEEETSELKAFYYARRLGLFEKAEYTSEDNLSVIKIPNEDLR